MTTLDFANSEFWQKYYDAMQGLPPRDTLVAALDRFAADGTPAGFAIDLGAGEGRDTVELLRRDWRVLAIDGTESGIATLRNRPDLMHVDRLQTQVARFEAVQLPPADFVNASFSLPFCPPEAFPQLWQQIVSAIAPGGRFAGQFFGDRDTWATIPARSHHTQSQVETLLHPFEVEMLQEDERDGMALDMPKHWHVFHVVARKRSH